MFIFSFSEIKFKIEGEKIRKMGSLIKLRHAKNELEKDFFLRNFWHSQDDLFQISYFLSRSSHTIIQAHVMFMTQFQDKPKKRNRKILLKCFLLRSTMWKSERRKRWKLENICSTSKDEFINRQMSLKSTKSMHKIWRKRNDILEQEK